MDERWVIIGNWGKFQHYRDRTAPWIKLYLELRDKDEWACLTLAERGLLVSIWITYSASSGVLPVSKLARKCGHRVRQAHLDSLVRQGFIQIVASKPPSLNASTEKRREEQTGKAALANPTQAKTKPRIPFAAVPGVNGPASDTEAYVRGLVANGVITEAFELNDFELDDHVRNELQARLH
jgi:hypothetical protein